MIPVSIVIQKRSNKLPELRDILLRYPAGTRGKEANLKIVIETDLWNDMWLTGRRIEQIAGVHYGNELKLGLRRIGLTLTF